MADGGEDRTPFQVVLEKEWECERKWKVLEKITRQTLMGKKLLLV